MSLTPVLWRPRLNRASAGVILAKGTLPITRSNGSAGANRSNGPVSMSASEYNARAIAAVVGSRSTPTISAPGGA
jgi:hypothetical protein